MFKKIQKPKHIFFFDQLLIVLTLVNVFAPSLYTLAIQQLEDLPSSQMEAEMREREALLGGGSMKKNSEAVMIKKPEKKNLSAVVAAKPTPSVQKSTSIRGSLSKKSVAEREALMYKGVSEPISSVAVEVPEPQERELSPSVGVPVIGQPAEEIKVEKPISASWSGEVYGGANVSVELLKGLRIRSGLGDVVHPDAIGISKSELSDMEVSRAEFQLKAEEGNLRSFEFGIPGQHLIFSKPVRITVDTPGIPDKTRVNILVKHAGDDDFTTTSLTDNINSSCNSDGTASQQIRSAVVHNGKITFFTCGASTFIINAAANNPYGIGFWFQGDAGTSCTTNGCSISQWNDLTPTGNHALQPLLSNQPILRTNVINSHSVVNFNATNKTMRGKYYGNYTTVFAVRNLASTGYQTLVAAPANSDYSVRANAGYNGTTNLNYTDGPNSQDWVGNRGTTNIFVNGYQTKVAPSNYHIVRMTAPAQIQNETFSLSSTFNNRGMTGDDSIAEIIMYSSPPNTTNTNRIESYLALKYGITLDQTTARNYFLSNGSTVWRSTTATTTYNKDIAGIARDDATTLNQTRSQSINNVNDLSVEAPSLANFSALTWSNNGLSQSSWVTTGVPTGYSRIARIWKFQETATDVGSVTVSYPASIVPTGKAPRLVLLKSTSATFPTASTTIIPGKLENGIWKFSVNIASSDFVSFASLNDTVAPVASLNIASGTILPSDSLDTTFTYSDGDSGIDTGSVIFDISRWDGVARTWTGISLGVVRTPITSTVYNLSFSGLSVGMYRLDAQVSDVGGNMTNLSSIFYKDSPEMIVSTGAQSFGNIMTDVFTQAESDVVVTVRTIGTPFEVVLQDTNFSGINSNITRWDGTQGYGVEIFNGISYGNILSSTAPFLTIGSQGRNIRVDGQRNTYTYRFRYAVQVPSSQTANDYSSTAALKLLLSY